MLILIITLFLTSLFNQTEVPMLNNPEMISSTENILIEELIGGPEAKIGEKPMEGNAVQNNLNEEQLRQTLENKMESELAQEDGELRDDNEQESEIDKLRNEELSEKVIEDY